MILAGKEDLIDPALFCRDCWALLADTATEGYTLADLYNLRDMKVCAIKDNAKYTIRDYDISIFTQEETGGLSINVAACYLQVRDKTMREQTCCFTGHRQLPKEERSEIANRLERVIAALYQQGIRYYGAGGALGFDTLAARTVIRLRESCPDMKLILVLPCLTQTRGWRLEDIAEYERIKAQAHKVVYTAQQYTRGSMHKRN